ncbi:hypothetical protein BGW42_001745 [Actinomortierella wolfii]|nr:hypothetical protein BGW42_001745 [Actinomortierella wolfii]
MNPINRNIPLLVAAGVGIFTGFYIWEPMFKKYERESKGTWNYEVVQQTRAEELKRVADQSAEAVSPAKGDASAATTSVPEEEAGPTKAADKSEGASQ